MEIVIIIVIGYSIKYLGLSIHTIKNNLSLINKINKRINLL